MCFLQDLSKKDYALLKLGRELKDLETVQDKLEKKEEELRSERNTVMEKKALKCIFIVSGFGVVNLQAKQEELPSTRCCINYLTHYARSSLNPYWVRLVNFSKYQNNPLITKMIFQSVTHGLERKTPSTPQYSDFFFRAACVTD